MTLPRSAFGAPPQGGDASGPAQPDPRRPLGWRLLFVLDHVLRLAAGAFVVALLATVTAGIVSRALNHPLSWTDEASGYLMVWLACLGWMLATRHRAHIRIRFFQDMLRQRAWRATEAAIQLGMAVLGGVIAWHAVHLVHTNADIEAMAMPVSAAWLYVPLVPAGLLTLVQALVDLRSQFGGLAHTGRDAAR